MFYWHIVAQGTAGVNRGGRLVVAVWCLPWPAGRWLVRVRWLRVL